MVKRSVDTSATPAHKADTRVQKLKTDSSGRLRLPIDEKRETAEDKAKGTVGEILDGLAAALGNDPNGYGQELWNNPDIGHPLQRLIKAREAHRDKFPIREDVFTPSDRPDAIPTTNLSAADVKARLTVDIVDRLQDPLFYVGPTDHPTMQVHGMRVDVSSSLASHGRPFSTRSLTLLDGSGKLIVARVGVTINEKARGLQQGHVIRLKEFHRYHMAKYDNRYSTAGIGLVDFEVVGFGQEPVSDGGPTAASRLETADLIAVVLEEADENTAPEPEEDVFDGWDETKERPPVPVACCTVANRCCSMYGTLFFRSCVCEEIPVPMASGLKEIADKYWATTVPCLGHSFLLDELCLP
mmetsp:Transcript_10141/g.28450  ORF Transcript_10141/g.28450 Transcript_10141/m.28450 type:complete len:355 (+) Transcript_10141:1176-2240(+)